MEPVQITWNMAFKIWWAILWRSLLLGIPPLLAVNFAERLGWMPPPLAQLFVFLVSILSSVATLKWWILAKDFGDFKLWPIREISN